MCGPLLSVATVANAQFKPATIDGGPEAVMKFVKVQKLMERGQKDAVVMFDRVVLTDKSIAIHALTTEITYASPGSGLFQDALLHALDAAYFTPALVDGKPTQVAFNGAATFSIKDGKPQLRVYANQEPNEIAAGHDFIAPQAIMTREKQPSVWEKELYNAKVLHKKGAAILSVSVDAAGKPTDVKVVSENPTGFNFGAAAARLTRESKFIPAFRDGKPVSCTVKTRHAFDTR